MEGAKVRLPTISESLSALHPVQLVGGEQTLMAVTPDGKVYATGWLLHIIEKLPLLLYESDSYGNSKLLQHETKEEIIRIRRAKGVNSVVHFIF